jgi:hypothetical protein
VSLSVTLLASYPKHVEIALNEVGINKKDDSKYIVETYLKPLGIDKYTNYCAAFVTYCLDKAGNVIEYTRTAVAQRFINKHSISASDVLNGKETIPAGSIVIWKYIGSWKGHVGFVLEIWIGKSGKTVEGNTSDNDTREGGNVEIKNRTINRHSSFRITHFTLVNYKEKTIEVAILRFAKNLGIVPVWNY